MAILIWLFWADVVIGIANLALLVTSVRRRSLPRALIHGVSIAMLAASAGMLWSVEGACLLPHPEVVAWHEGMTICPGQSARMPPLEITVPGTGRDL